MHVPSNKKWEYWNHFMTRLFIGKVGGGHGVTGPRLAKIQREIWNDGEFWADVVARHGGLDQTPEEMRRHDEETYNHCLGNFWGQIYQTMIEEGLIKP